MPAWGINRLHSERTIESVFLFSDASVRAFIIRGEGKFFSTGLDVDFLATQTGDYIQSFRDANAALDRRLCTFPIVTVAILNGKAVTITCYHQKSMKSPHRAPTRHINSLQYWFVPT